MRGKIYERDAMLLRVLVGTTTSGNTGIDYELAITVGHNPQVKSMKTGRTFSLSWEELIAIAINAGIDNEPELSDAPTANLGELRLAVTTPKPPQP